MRHYAVDQAKDFVKVGRRCIKFDPSETLGLESTTPVSSKFDCEKRIAVVST